jgi:hypothetical protein
MYLQGLPIAITRTREFCKITRTREERGVYAKGDEVD